MSLRDVARRLEVPDSPFLGSARALSRRIRWLDGWQGVGPLSGMTLLRTVSPGPPSESFKSLSEAYKHVDGGDPPKSLREAYARLGYPLGNGLTRLPVGPVSLTEAARRVIGTQVVPIRLLSYNTFLMVAVEIPLRKWLDRAVGWAALAWFGIPIDTSLLGLFGLTVPVAAVVAAFVITEVLEEAGVAPSDVIEKVRGTQIQPLRIASKPAVARSGPDMIGSTVSLYVQEDPDDPDSPAVPRYDVCCLSKVWRPGAANAVIASLKGPWTAVQGKDDEGEFQILGSGLLFLARKYPVTRTDRLIYKDCGDRRHDSDAWSNKGAMFNAINVGIGELELVQTHLYYGGSMPVSFGGFRDPTDAERLGVWRHELDELVEFIHRNHRAENVLIVTGDFNMDGADIRQYSEMRSRMDSLGLQDLWAWDVLRHRPSEGQTCRFTDGPENKWDKTFSVCTPSTGPSSDVFCRDDDAVPYHRRVSRSRASAAITSCGRNVPHGTTVTTSKISQLVRRPFPWTDGNRTCLTISGLR